MINSERMVSLMIYCDLLRKNGNSAVYKFGGTTDDMTGEIEFFRDREPVVIKEPSERKVAKMWIGKLFIKYRKDIKNGVFKEKMAYEC